MPRTQGCSNLCHPRKATTDIPVRRALLLIALALLIPIVPFLLLGDAFEAQTLQWSQREWSDGELSLVTIGLLSADILLPVPASGVCTYAAGVLGFWQGAFAAWLGMSVGAMLGYEAARILGHPLARRLISTDDLTRLERTETQRGVWSLVLLRPVPVLAEASVILAGSLRLRRAAFLAAVLSTNAVIACVYAAFGAFAQSHDALGLAVAASLAIPLAALFALRRRL